MSMPAIDFVGVWTLILGVGMFLYVLLDGFDLGIGILYGFAPSEEARGPMMASIAPVWDGNETWLILGAVALFTIFPLAFAIIIPAVYFPIIAMLLGLAFRGVAFEFRFKDPAHRAFWDRSFFVGSAVATLAQGMVIGAFVQGFKVDGRHFAGSTMDWLTPFSVLTGIALLFGYALLGATWLIIKTDGDLLAWARRQARWLMAGALISLALVSVWTAFLSPAIVARWFSTPNIYFLWVIPVGSLLLARWAWVALARGSETVPFTATVLLFLLAYLGMTISVWPNIVPPVYTFWDAAASPSTQGFLLVGTLILLPVVLLYSGWSYWVFRGKVRGDIGYH